MRYKDGTAFRVALEARLNRMAVDARPGTLARLRRMVAFDRLLARLAIAAPDRWVVKGGIALDLRLGPRARLTRDLDLVRYDTVEAAEEDLIAAAKLELADFFAFEIRRHTTLSAIEEVDVVRYQIEASLAGRRFEQIRLDIGLSEPFGLSPDRFRLPDLLTFAEFTPIEVPTLPLDLHLAEKVHAYVRIYANERPSTRVKDLIDLVLIRSAFNFQADRVRRALTFTFGNRSVAELPTALPLPPDDWLDTYRTLATEVGMEPDIDFGFQLVSEFLDPLLNGIVDDNARWASELGLWQSPQS